MAQSSNAQAGATTRVVEFVLAATRLPLTVTEAVAARSGFSIEDKPLVVAYDSAQAQVKKLIGGLIHDHALVEHGVMQEQALRRRLTGDWPAGGVLQDEPDEAQPGRPSPASSPPPGSGPAAPGSHPQMENSNPAESMDAEGLPELDDHPPGIDADLDEESVMVPRDHPVAAGADPAYAVTAAEESTPESVSDRARRESRDVGAEELGVGGSVQGQRGQDANRPDEGTGIPPDPGVAESAEEAAVHIRSDDDEL